MPITNGSGQGGGNGSIWWSVKYGKNKQGKPRKPKYCAKKLTAGKGEVVVNGHVEGHDAFAFADIGKPHHPGFFRVVLRFKPTLMKKLKTSKTATAAIVNAHGKKYSQLTGYGAKLRNPRDGSIFLELDVPAIKRPKPIKGQQWKEMPWEIVWGW